MWKLQWKYRQKLTTPVQSEIITKLCIKITKYKEKKKLLVIQANLDGGPQACKWACNSGCSPLHIFS